MPTMYALGGNSGGVCLAVPSYGAMSPAFVFALCSSIRALTEAGIPHQVLLLAGNCHVDDARNSMVRRFLTTPCSDLMFLDADLSWNAHDLIRMLGYDLDVVAGIYPLKQDAEGYPCRLLKGATPVRADGLIEVEGVPGGFLRIRRNVLEALELRSQSYLERPDDETRAPLIFERRIESGERFSGDYVFCRKWRAMGGRIFVDPVIHFSHVGEKAWNGCFAEHLLKLNPLEAAA